MLDILSCGIEKLMAKIEKDKDKYIYMDAEDIYDFGDEPDTGIKVWKSSNLTTKFKTKLYHYVAHSKFCQIF